MIISRKSVLSALGALAMGLFMTSSASEADDNATAYVASLETNYTANCVENHPEQSLSACMDDSWHYSHTFNYENYAAEWFAYLQIPNWNSQNCSNYMYSCPTILYYNEYWVAVLTKISAKFIV